MEQRVLGATGIEVGLIGLGGMPLSLQDRPSESDSIRVIHAALDAGMSLIDTADVYCIDDNDMGHNEALIRKALNQWTGDADNIVVATKGGLRRPKGQWVADGRPRHLRRACEKSLKALGVEAITLYQLHAPDDGVPYADSVGELKQLQQEGKIQHIGLSNVSIAELEQAQTIATVASVQNRCNVLDLRAFHAGIIEHCELHGMAFLAYSPVGGSRGKHQVDQHPLLNDVASRYEVTPFQLALSWLVGRSPCIFPIPGASRVESAVSSAAAADLKLTDEDVAELNRTFGLF